MKAYSLQQREQVMADYDAGLTYQQLHERYGISSSCLRKYIRQRRETGSIAPLPHGGGAHRALESDQYQLLRELREANLEATQRELAERIEEHCGASVSLATISRYFREMGIEYKRRPACPKVYDAAFRKQKKGSYQENPTEKQREALNKPQSQRKGYPTDLTDAEWRILEPFIPESSPGGRPEKHSRREIVNGILYATRAGCAWRLLPHDLPPWKTIYHYFREWRLTGLWSKVNEALREKVRHKAGREATPSAAIMDSQSVKTTEKGGSMALTGAKRSMEENAMPW